MNAGAKHGDGGADQMLFDYLQTTILLAPAGSVKLPFFHLFKVHM